MNLRNIAGQYAICGNGVNMSKKCALFLPLLAAVILLAGCTKTEFSRNSSDPSGTAQSSGEEAQPLSFEATDTEGNSVSGDIFSRSKLTMVNVWATYCNPCLREMPGLGELAEEYDSEEFQILGIISDIPEGTEPKTMELELYRKPQSIHTFSPNPNAFHTDHYRFSPYIGQFAGGDPHAQKYDSGQRSSDPPESVTLFPKAH